MLVLALAPVAALAAVRSTEPPPLATVASTIAPREVVTGATTPLPWPTAGEAAVGIPALGYEAQSAAEKPVPVASLTKIMTALIVLRDHPISPTQTGPSLTMTAQDVADFFSDTAGDGSGVPVASGEVLTERQLLEGLLVHSANNLANTLARWDAGSVPAFVEKMNTVAAAMGLVDTHFVDDSGYDPGSQSTAADILRLASSAILDPTFSSLVAMPSATLPVAGTVSTFTPLLGQDDVVGVKSGFTGAAGGCDAMLAVRQVDGQPLLVLAVVTGQQGADVLGTAGSSALHLVDAVTGDVHPLAVVRAGEPLGRATVRTGSVPAVARRSVTVLAIGGQVVHQHLVVTHEPRAGAAPGPVGTAGFRLGTQLATVEVATAKPIPSIPLLLRIF